MLGNYEKIINLLKSLQNMKTVNSAEKQMIMLSSEPYFLKTLQEIIKAQNVQQRVKRMGAIYLNKCIVQQYSELDQNFIITILMQILFDFKIPQICKDALEKSLTLMLQWSDRTSLNKIVGNILNLIDALTKYQPTSSSTSTQSTKMQEDMVENNKIPPDFHEALKTLLLLIKAFLNSNSNSQDLKTIIQKSFQKSLKLCELNLRNIKNILMNMQIIKLWKQVLNKLSSSNDPDHPLIITNICTSNALMKYLTEIYEFMCIPNRLSYLDIEYDLELFHKECNKEQFKQSDPLDQKILYCNNIILAVKKQAASLHQEILMISQHQSLTVQRKIYQFVLVSAPRIIETLALFANYRSVYQDKYQEGYVEEFITSILSMFTLCYKQRISQFKNLYPQIFHQIVCPFLAITENQEQLFEINSQEFIEISNDCCNHQENHILKTQAARLLECLADESLASGSYIIRHCIISLQISYKLINNVEGLNKQQKNSYKFLQNETSFLILSILSYKLNNFHFEMQELKKIILNISIQDMPDVQLSRLYLLLAYNYLEIFQQDLNEGSKLIQYALMQEDRPETVQLTCLDFIENITDQYYNDFYLKTFSEKLASPFKSCSVMLKMIPKILFHHIDKISESNMCYFVTHIIQRIQAEIILYKEKRESTTQNITTCLQSIRKIVQNANYIQNKPQLQSLIWRVFSSFSVFKELYLDDEIIQLLNTFINANQSRFITEQRYYDLLPLALEQFQNEKYSITLYYLLFNNFIMRSHHTMIQTVIEVLIQGLYYLYNLCYQNNSLPNTNSYKNKLGIANTLILLQNYVAIHGDTIHHSLLREIGKIATIVIPDRNQPQVITEGIIIARGLNLMLLCHMQLKNNNNYNENLNKVLQSIQQNANNHNLAQYNDNNWLRYILFFHEEQIFKSYDSTVLITCLSQQIFHQTDLISVTEIINIMTRVIHSLQEMETQNNQKITIKSKNNANSIKKQSLKIKIRRIEDYQNILKFMKTPFNYSKSYENTAEKSNKGKNTIETNENKDFKFYSSTSHSVGQNIRKLEQRLKHVIQIMKTNNPMLYHQLATSLPSEVRQKLSNIMNKFNIEGHCRKIIKTHGVKDASMVSENSQKKRSEEEKSLKRAPHQWSEDQLRDQEQMEDVQEKEIAFKKKTLKKKKNKKDQMKE